jgi:hypothetical protein
LPLPNVAATFSVRRVVDGAVLGIGHKKAA